MLAFGGLGCIVGHVCVNAGERKVILDCDAQSARGLVGCSRSTRHGGNEYVCQNMVVDTKMFVARGAVRARDGENMAWITMQRYVYVQCVLAALVRM